MDRDRLEQLLESVRDGAVGIGEAVRLLSHSPGSHHDFARLDHHRSIRCGFPEVVFCQGKTSEQIGAIAGEMLQRNDRVLFTRADRAAFDAVKEHFPEAHYHERARAIECVRDAENEPPGEGLVAVITAGTADIPVAEEAAVTARMMGAEVRTAFDLGVAGIHRVLSEQDLLRSAPRPGGRGRHGRRPRQRRGRAGGPPGDRRAHQRRLRGPRSRVSPRCWAC